MYSKSYTKRIDNSRMSLGYQPPKFQQFDGNGNRKQHIAHFLETCKNARSRGDQLVRQFVRSLKGNTFEWYTNLEPKVINSQEQIEKKFLNRFYSTTCVELILKLGREKKIELDIDEVAQANHVAIEMNLTVLPLTLLYDQRESLIQLETSEPIVVQFQQRMVMVDFQNKEEHVKNDGER
ncbi:retrotransposon gag protein [Cucumis melo var. makuwa]|uniref:Retrotransposon gag protein n=1 Tax=Cucumis melo var. makuwa TaxID=1194695 RepID=A0A5D3E344_CUCMM|nr:retrotransposon gag protein [Cucumis melo var. makuwa]TYK30306.1 retrotransposon gag protein [Cucumis melo var. makuwa]